MSKEIELEIKSIKGRIPGLSRPYVKIGIFCDGEIWPGRILYLNDSIKIKVDTELSWAGVKRS